MALLVKNGTIVTPTDEYVADVYAEGETITLIGRDLDIPDAQVIDAQGMYVLPGAVDPHTHIEFPFGGATTIDTWTSATTAAAFGGTTSLVDFCVQTPGASVFSALEDWHAKLENNKPVIDVGFHIAVTDLTFPGTLNDLTRLVDEEGITSYKLFMAYKGAVMADDEVLFRVLQNARESGARTMVHAENGDAIDILVQQAVDAGHTSPHWHGATRPPETEGEATNRAIQLAHIAGAPLYIVHVSCREALEPLERARSAGWDVHGETCPQYLFTDETALDKPNFEGAKYIFTPPPRARENQPLLWRGLANDTLSVVSTDHCPFNWADQKTLGRDDFTKVPNGAPGIEDRLLMLNHFGVNEGRISRQRLVELVSTNPARLFGLYPRKGSVAVGSDADLVVFDPHKRHTISARDHHSAVDYNLFEGTTVVGAPRTVTVRGQVVIHDGELVAAPGVGRFVKRARVGERLEA